jgi:hypothetical protein
MALAKSKNSGGLFKLADRRILANTTKVLATLVGVIGTIYGFHAYITKRIQDVVESETFLRSLSSKIRPMCIFDENGSILYDQGAMEVIDEIKILKKFDTGKVPSSILIRPNRYLSTAPVLTPLSEYVASVTAKRGEKFDWVLNVNLTSAVFMEHDTSFQTATFRLEILY